MNIPLIWLAFITGIILGAFASVFVLGLCMMQTRNDEEGELMKTSKITMPTEDTFHKYHVLRIPVNRRSEQLIIGVEKARAILTWIDEIREFLNKYSQEEKSS
jgi:hypothetical protein